LVLSVPLPLMPVKSPSPPAYGWGSSFYFGDDDFSEDFRRNGAHWGPSNAIELFVVDAERRIVPRPGTN